MPSIFLGVDEAHQAILCQMLRAGRRIGTHVDENAGSLERGKSDGDAGPFDTLEKQSGAKPGSDHGTGVPSADHSIRHPGGH